VILAESGKKEGTLRRQRIGFRKIRQLINRWMRESSQCNTIRNVKSQGT
jgi:hypothetical protein